MNINFYKKAEEMRKKAEKEKIEQEKKKKEKINQEKKKQEMAKKEKEVKDKTTAETRKKEIDKFNSLLYNKNNNTLNDAWKRTKEMELRYAGDSARESVEKGLKESSDFMKDAPEGTDYGKVQTASVKWRLANDTDNKELQKSAFDELTGHLSSENKETYLKNARSLQEYINAKDTFDYKRNNYTTTKSANSEYNEEIRKLQKILNINGYTDKFGDILKEDGIYGAKTRYAHDKMAENTKKTNPDMPAELANMMLPNLAQTWGNGTPKKTGFEKYNNINFDPIDILSKQGETYKNDNGVVKWYKLPDVEKRLPKETEMFKKGEMTPEVYNAFDKLSRRWYYADTEEARKELSGIAQDVRNNNYKIKDCTKEANEQLRKNGKLILERNILDQDESNLESGFESIIWDLIVDTTSVGLSGYEWFNKVNNKKPWDYKSEPKKADWLPDEKYFFYYDEIIDKSAFGNLNYGYTGTILGLTPTTLYKGGGMVSENPTQYEIDHYYSDTEVDHYWITQGINQAHSQGYKGSTPLPVNLIFKGLKLKNYLKENIDEL